MAHVATSMAPNGPGILPMRHRGFDQDNPSWDIHMRAAMLGFEVTGRDDNQTQTSVGAWKEDPDTRGDLNCANYWQADYGQRPVGCWGFGYASVIQKSANSGTTTGQSFYGNSDTTKTENGSPEVIPIGQGGQADTRFKTKKPIILQPEGEAQADPNSPSAGAGAGGAGGANGPAGPNGPGNGGGADPAKNNDNGIVDLGGGWVYQDGAIAYQGPSRNVDSLSGMNPGKGFTQFTYGGSNSTSALTGMQGVGFHTGFAGFSGVRNFFGGGGSVGFSYSGGSR